MNAPPATASKGSRWNIHLASWGAAAAAISPNASPAASPGSNRRSSCKMHSPLYVLHAVPPRSVAACSDPCPNSECGARSPKAMPNSPSRPSTRPISRFASIPRSGLDPCAARPATRISTHKNPLCATHRSIPVGSVTIAASVRTCRRSSSVPKLANSSSATAAKTRSPRNAGPRATSANAATAAASPPFMS